MNTSQKKNNIRTVNLKINRKNIALDGKNVNSCLYLAIMQED
ncbi:hypothetical protein [Christiangramia antarctica]|uniref:Transposase n=1 Tax=Christiangramia antarctica TaxID=2058158 RepID=A0ABW5X791_9FLAO